MGSSYRLVCIAGVPFEELLEKEPFRREEAETRYNELTGIPYTIPRQVIVFRLKNGREFSRSSAWSDSFGVRKYFDGAGLEACGWESNCVVGTVLASSRHLSMGNEPKLDQPSAG